MNTPLPKNVGLRRSVLLMGGATFLTAAGYTLLLNSYSGQQIFWSDYIILALFPLLFAQLAVAFILALFGFGDWLRGGDPFHVMRRSWREREQSIPLAATAIVIPVFNEEVERVSHGVENMWRSLEKTGLIEHFDFYICSDSSDVDHWIEEECAWLHLCQKLNAFGKIFYRKRHHSINGKSGNIADFCRRWGKLYRYMIVLDADSIMSGSTMVRLVRAMESNPEVGILQTQPAMVLGQSLFRRVLQFSNKVYGKILSQGCSLAQMSAGSYWGHNAIIRVAPFIKYCALPILPVPDSHARHIMSHDTIEAALMQRAGYEVWIAYDEADSYEEGPPNLSDMLKRDRRWCAGNLQHFWFLFARDIKMGNRLQIWIGLMSYLCSPIWLTFMVAGCFSAHDRARFLAYSAGPEDLGATQSFAPLLLLMTTMILLFTPRLLGALSVLPRMKQFGGLCRLFCSTCFETLISMLLAPVIMLFHTLFVLQTLLGWQIKWTSQNRADSGLSLSHCIRLYGWQSCLGIVTQMVFWYNLGFSYWSMSIVGAWILAPLTVWISSSPNLGRWFQSRGWFLIPEESHLATELEGLISDDAEKLQKPPNSLWIQALLCPYVQAVHLSMVRQRAASNTEDKPKTSTGDLRERLIKDGPATLKLEEKQRLLWDAETVFWLHQELWRHPEAGLHPSWNQFQFDCGKNDLLRKYLVLSQK